MMSLTLKCSYGDNDCSYEWRNPGYKIQNPEKRLILVQMFTWGSFWRIIHLPVYCIHNINITYIYDSFHLNYQSTSGGLTRVRIMLTCQTPWSRYHLFMKKVHNFTVMIFQKQPYQIHDGLKAPVMVQYFVIFIGVMHYVDVPNTKSCTSTWKAPAVSHRAAWFNR